MKTKTQINIAAVLSSFFILHSAFGQGSLTPPGAPAPTMKSLAEVEPRTPISSVPFTINSSGSYYLTTNLTATVSNAIVIAASGVTLDLNGFTISSTTASATGYGILLSGSLSDITIVNGHIRGGVTNNGSGVFSGPGFQAGIIYSGLGPVNCRVSGVSVSGCLSSGINLGSTSTLVDCCTVRTIGSFGITASTITRSTANDCGVTGINGNEVSDCHGESRGNGDGISAITAQNCFGLCHGSGYGINSTSAENCYGVSVNSVGLAASCALNSYGSSDGSSQGIAASTAQNCYGANNGSGLGLFALSANNCRGFGISGHGIDAETANNCYGASDLSRGIFANVAIGCSGSCGGGSYGLFATSVANTCYGISDSGTGLNAPIVIGCVGANNSGASVGYTYKYNMP